MRRQRVHIHVQCIRTGRANIGARQQLQVGRNHVSQRRTTINNAAVLRFNPNITGSRIQQTQRDVAHRRQVTDIAATGRGARRIRVHGDYASSFHIQIAANRHVTVRRLGDRATSDQTGVARRRFYRVINRQITRRIQQQIAARCSHGVSHGQTIGHRLNLHVVSGQYIRQRTYRRRRRSAVQTNAGDIEVRHRGQVQAIRFADIDVAGGGLRRQRVHIHVQCIRTGRANIGARQQLQVGRNHVSQRRTTINNAAVLRFNPNITGSRIQQTQRDVAHRRQVTDIAATGRGARRIRVHGDRTTGFHIQIAANSHVTVRRLGDRATSDQAGVARRCCHSVINRQITGRIQQQIVARRSHGFSNLNVTISFNKQTQGCGRTGQSGNRIQYGRTIRRIDIRHVEGRYVTNDQAAFGTQVGAAGGAGQCQGAGIDLNSIRAGANVITEKLQVIGRGVRVVIATIEDGPHRINTQVVSTDAAEGNVTAGLNATVADRRCRGTIRHYDTVFGDQADIAIRCGAAVNRELDIAYRTDLLDINQRCADYRCINQDATVVSKQTEVAGGSRGRLTHRQITGFRQHQKCFCRQAVSGVSQQVSH